MGREDTHLVLDAELLQDLDGAVEHLEIRLAAHDDADEGIRHLAPVANGAGRVKLIPSGP